MMRPRRGGLTVLSAALLITVLSAALLTMPAGAVVNPVNPRIPNGNPVNPEIPKVKKVCLPDGSHGYEFEVRPTQQHKVADGQPRDLGPGFRDRDNGHGRVHL